jgi:hypothetical protein
MSFRDGIYDSDYFRRQQNRRIREAELAGLRAAGRASDLDTEIARRKRSEKLKECHDRMHKEKASILESISQHWLCTRWSQQLNDIDLTSPGAEEELKRLVQDVEGYGGYGGFKLPDPPPWWKNVPGLDKWAITREVRRAVTGGLDDLYTMTSLGREMEERERNQQRERVASDLASIVSSLNFLLTNVRLYGHYRNLPLDVYRSM